MNKILDPLCHNQPRWVLIELQAATYGFLCWASDVIDEKSKKKAEPLSSAEYLEGVDTHFIGWPSEWLEDVIEDLLVYCILEKHMTLETIQRIYGEAEDCFRNHVPADLMIFTQLATGESLSEEQWTRLYDTIAFQPPDNICSFTGHKNGRHRTMRIHGRRSITPMKRHKYRGKTAHKRTQAYPLIVKETV